MKLKDIKERLDLKVLCALDMLNTKVNDAYSSDLLSDVMAHSKKGNVWITLQTHQNVVAVAKLKDLAGIIIVNNRKPDEETLRKAKEENLPLLTTSDNAFTISGKLYQMLNPKE